MTPLNRSVGKNYLLSDHNDLQNDLGIAQIVAQITVSIRAIPFPDVVIM